ncbi:alpha/beta hydrolase-fold protein [Cellulomonas sp.]|uniref:alpha/beta hydrolase n=1 Tax=Cellulomonas sp. TaxID=40001 RepID=UPI001B100A7D|nr:alpha/beta hydrolase-fold protein [Cellulomonas sp.]MBO9555927.1 hypothetical protein [Cellulomonas sp.]
MPDTVPASVLRELAGGGDALSSWWTVVALGLLAVATALAAVRRRRAPLRARTWPLWSTVAATGALMSLLAVNCVVGYVPDVSAARTTLSSWGLLPPPHLAHGKPSARAAGAGTGAVRAVRVPVDRDLRMPPSLTWVYTPPGYDPQGTRRYPVVYLVHGSPGRSGDWFAAGQVPRVMDVLLAHHLVRPMIVIAPDVNGVGRGGRDTECLNSAHGGSQVETYLDDVLVPWVDAHYATRADWRHRTVGGFSSGAFCALDQGLRHPDLFGTILAIGPYGDPGSGGRTMLGGGAAWAAHAPSRYLPTVPLPHRIAVFLDSAGRMPDEETRARSLADLLVARGQDVESRTEPGAGHTWHMARAAAPFALVFASQHG